MQLVPAHIAERDRRVGIRKGLGPGVGSLQVQALPEMALQGDNHRVIARVTEVLKAAVTLDKVILREWTKRLSQIAGEGGVGRIHATIGTTLRNIELAAVELVSQGKVLLGDIVIVRKIAGTKILRYLAYVPHFEDKVLGDFVLQLQAPVAGHRRPAIAGNDDFAAHGIELAHTAGELAGIGAGSK